MAAPGTALPAGFPYTASIDLRASTRRTPQRKTAYEAAWDAGGFTFLSGSFADIALDEAANKTAADFVRGKIDEIVRDPDTAEMLKPWDFPIGTKRLPLDTELLRDVQPAQRHPGRPEADADRGDHRGRHQDERLPARPGHDRLRHRVRRAHRAA